MFAASKRVSLHKLKRRVNKLKENEKFFFIMSFCDVHSPLNAEKLNELRDYVKEKEAKMSITQFNNAIADFYYVVAIHKPFKKTS